MVRTRLSDKAGGGQLVEEQARQVHPARCAAAPRRLKDGWSPYLTVDTHKVVSVLIAQECYPGPYRPLGICKHASHDYFELATLPRRRGHRRWRDGVGNRPGRSTGRP